MTQSTQAQAQTSDTYVGGPRIGLSPQPKESFYKWLPAWIGLAITVIMIIFGLGYSWASVEHVTGDVIELQTTNLNQEDRIRELEATSVRSDQRLANIEDGIVEIKGLIRDE